LLLNVLETFPLEVLGISLTLNAFPRTLITKWLFITSADNPRAYCTFLSSHFNRLVLQVIQPVLLFLCLGLVVGGFLIAPGVGCMGTLPIPFFSPRGTGGCNPFIDIAMQSLTDESHRDKLRSAIRATEGACVVVCCVGTGRGFLVGKRQKLLLLFFFEAAVWWQSWVLPSLVTVYRKRRHKNLITYRVHI
jgi:hypothetical protein